MRGLRRRYGRSTAPKQRGPIQWYVVLDIEEPDVTIPAPIAPGVFAQNGRHAEAKAERLAEEDGYDVRATHRATVKSDPIYKLA